jgi:NADH-quinone oxidoreductase subunit J
MQTTILVICLVFMLISGMAAAMFRSNLKAAISLALTSVFLAIILFLMHTPWAALFELSVCAGLVTVIFVSTISMTTKERDSEANVADYHSRFAMMPFILIFAGIALVAVVLLNGFDIQPVTTDVTAAASNFKEVFWNTRQADILGQVIIILAGAFAVAILFKESDKA